MENDSTAQTSLLICRAGDGSARERGTKPLLLGSVSERDERQQLSLEVKSMEKNCESCKQACKGQREILMEGVRKTNKKILLSKNHTHKADIKLA